MNGEFEKLIRVVKTSAAGFQDIFVRTVERSVMVASRATAATSAASMIFDKGL